MPEPQKTSPTKTLHTGSNRVIARQAILDEARTVFGYELFDRSLQGAEHNAASDAQLLFNALSTAENDSLASRKTIFINCTHDSLAGGHLHRQDVTPLVVAR